MGAEGWFWLETQTQAAERLSWSERCHPGFKAPCSQVLQFRQTASLCSLHLLPLPWKQIGGISFRVFRYFKTYSIRKGGNVSSNQTEQHSPSLSLYVLIKLTKNTFNRLKYRSCSCQCQGLSVTVTQINQHFFASTAVDKREEHSVTSCLLLIYWMLFKEALFSLPTSKMSDGCHFWCNNRHLFPPEILC